MEQGRLSERDLELLAIDAFSAFAEKPELWPDRVEINRSGLTDANVRGTWAFDDRTEFFNVRFRGLESSSSAELDTSPDSSGASE